MTLSSKVINAAIASISTAILFAAIAVPTLYKIQAAEDSRSKIIAELVGKGVDPIAARCALADSKDYLCLTFVATRAVSAK